MFNAGSEGTIEDVSEAITAVFGDGDEEGGGEGGRGGGEEGGSGGRGGGINGG